MHHRWGGHPKIAALLAEPRAQLIRQLVGTARQLGIAPTIYAGLRLREQTFVYDDLDHPDRATRVLEGPAYVTEDHALLFGLDLYEQSLCPGPCGWPRHVAWHADMDGWFEDHTVKCQACTAMQADPSKPVLYHYVVDTRAEDDKELTPFVIGLTTAPA